MSDEYYDDDAAADAHWAAVDRLKRAEAMPYCLECGKVAHPTTAIMVDKAPEAATWVVLDRFTGIYCKADCALDAYLRGYGQHKATRGTYK